ncbi:MAG: PQQ-dependent sugar dehydrogenase [Bacteroidia bacterium]|nr:PQQ-dependent sugar dehydrogenase [Bacteroidia bacterium]
MIRFARKIFPILSFLFIVFCFSQCSKVVELPLSDVDNGGLLLPEDFGAVVVVDSLDGRARQLAVNDNGDIYVKLMLKNAGGNVALRDTTGDGKADVIEKFGDYQDNGNYGTAMRINNGHLYFSSELAVYRYKLAPGELLPTSAIETILIDDHPHGTHEHNGKPIALDNKGNMYVPFGAPSNACQELNRTPSSPGIDPCPMLDDHAGIWRFDANKIGQTQKDGTKFASGLRSIVAIDWNTADDNLYVVMHGRDDLLRLWSGVFTPWQSAELPSEEFLRIKEGSDAGWPYCYYDQIQEKKVLAPEYGGDGDSIGRCSTYEKPLIGFPGHWAPNDLFFYSGDQFPDHYKNGAFIAFHGSTNRAPYPQAGYFIGFVPFVNGEPTGKWEVFADGFAGIDPIVNVSDARYRPMGIAMGPDGSLYISETEHGKIWRIMYKGEKDKFGESQLAKMEMRKTESHIRRAHPVNDNLDKDIIAGGEKIYNVYCGSCHQQNGLGASGRFPSLAGTPWVIGEKTKLISIVLNGLEGPIEVNGEAFNSTMPKHNFLGDAELANVLTYIRQNFGNKATAISPDDVKKIRTISNN